MSTNFLVGCDCEFCHKARQEQVETHVISQAPAKTQIQGGLAGAPEEVSFARRMRRVLKTTPLAKSPAPAASPSGFKITEEKDVAILTAAQWEKMNEKAQWDIKVALRGPDSYYGETLKWYTTGVIRGRCRKVFRVGGSVNQDLRAVVLPDDRHSDVTYKKAGKFGWNASHFLEHVEAAASWLNIPILHIPTETWHEVMQMSNTVSAGQAILQAAAGKDRDPNPIAIAEIKRHVERNQREQS